jgi:negative regulator of replication initiation
LKSVNDKRLLELIEEVDGLEQRLAEQSGLVSKLVSDRDQAAESDLDREARAVKSGSAAPELKEPKVARDLKDAQHSLRVIERAWALAQSDLGAYKAKHAQRLVVELQKAKSARAQAVAQAARPLLEELRSFFACDDDAKLLKPYLQQVQETGPPGTGEPERLTQVFGGAVTTRNVFGDKVAGLERGQLEQVIGTLVRLPSGYPEPSREASKEPNQEAVSKEAG